VRDVPQSGDADRVVSRQLVCRLLDDREADEKVVMRRNASSVALKELAV
jgi:hypothetical protein